ncbi:hypothetical protein SUGI_1015930 [Cryptomeria japonica]|nr:hypothetical protein SUGI_1015930 [Cryptomeria japonica]
MPAVSMELHCIQRPYACTNRFPDMYQSCLATQGFKPLFIHKSLKFRRRNCLKSNLNRPAVHCTAQLPDLVKDIVDKSHSSFENITENLVNGGKLSERLQGFESSASNFMHSLGVENIVSREKLSEKIELLEGSASFLVEKVRYLVENSGNIAESFGSGVDLKLADNFVLLERSASSLLHKLLVATSNMNNSESVVELSHSVVNLLERLWILSAYLGSQLGNLLAGVVDDPQKFNAVSGQIGAALGMYSGKLSMAPVPVATTALATLAGSVAVKTAFDKRNLEGGDALPLRYDPEANLAIDIATGMVKENEKQRAAEFVQLITRLGPTTIKIGQALSIRPDILPVAYLGELQKLQDRVPPFSNEVAKQLIEEGLGRPVEEVLKEISSEPVAAASLGQVYKGILRDTGEVVAVKVQRPGVLEGISRDLFLLRNASQALQSLPFIESNLVALLDNWAFRFFDELDYVQEGKNAEQFAENMKSLKNIVVPGVFLQHTSRKVLITQWIEGEKLSESSEADLLLLVNTALNCYLVQLLESGFLHADPHPGNLLRTTDGCLCVLDYGLMTEVTQEQRYTFIEYMSHLVNSDYGKVANDLVRLGFVPPELVDPVKTAEVVPHLSRVLGQLTQGGGARKVNIQQVTEDLAKISEDYVFVIPPYFALILKAFAVLEGIGLKADPNYAIINDCYPYLSKRLMTDDSPRTRAALKYFLYGESDRLEVKRVEDIMNGFATFQKLTSAPATTGKSQRVPSPIDPAAKEFISLLFAPHGSFLQELLLKELVLAVDALSREALAELWTFFAFQAPIPFLPNLFQPKSWPIPLSSIFFGSRRIVSLSEEDEYSLDTVKRLWILLEPQFRQPTFLTEMAGLVQGMIPLMPDLFPGILMTSQRFLLMLLQRKALRLADDLDGKNSLAVRERDPIAFSHRAGPEMLLPAPQRDKNT